MKAEAMDGIVNQVEDRQRREEEALVEVVAALDTLEEFAYRWSVERFREWEEFQGWLMVRHRRLKQARTNREGEGG